MNCPENKVPTYYSVLEIELLEALLRDSESFDNTELALGVS